MVFSFRWMLALIGVAWLGWATFATHAATWCTNQPMATARQFHTATLLPDGRVLVAGGQDANYQASPTAELYDCATGCWQPARSMSVGRISHTATLMPNGLVLIVGGSSVGGAVLNSAEWFDPMTGHWSATTAMNVARDGHTATLLPNGKLLIAGGWNGGALTSAELFDPTNGTWTVLSTMISSRFAHAATLLTNGTVLVTGGMDNTLSPTYNSEYYDPSTDVWTATANMISMRHMHRSVLLQSGKVLVTGRGVCCAELYDPVAQTWTSTSPILNEFATPPDLFGQSVTTLPDGMILMASGVDYSVAGFYPTAHAWLYDPVLDHWSQPVPMNVGRSAHSATLLADGRVLVAGGGRDVPPFRLSSVEVFLQFDPVLLQGQWSSSSNCFQLNFTNTPGQHFTAMAAPDTSTASSNWVSLGVVSESSPGHYLFADGQAASHPQRFYKVIGF